MQPVTSTAYGVVLNDREEREILAEAFNQPPYKSPPVAPVLYIKPRPCFAASGSTVLMPDDVTVAATIGLLFARDTVRATHDDALSGVGGACLALDVFDPHPDYYRPAIRERSRDGYLPLGLPGNCPKPPLDIDIVTLIDGTERHRWHLSRLVRGLQELIVDISAFMTLAAGDLLLVGIPYDAPRVKHGQKVEARCGDLPSVSATFIRETQR